MKTKTPNDLAKRIKKLRLLHGYKQEQMAQEIGLSQTAYSKIETGDTSLTVGRAAMIAKAFGMSLTALLEWEENILK